MTRKAFVIGHPIAHSRSPLIHGHWIEEHGLDASYEAFDIEPTGLVGFLTRLRTGEFVGGNVTIPLKQTVFGLCDSVDPLAMEIGAVNTLVGNAGMVRGFNTDFMGFLGNLDQSAPGWDQGLDTAIVLGAGGAARAILVALAHREIKTVHVLNRTLEKARSLTESLNGPYRPGPLSAFGQVAPKAGLVVNTTSVGMHGTSFEGLALEILPDTALVTDIVYSPLETPLLAAAAARGLRTVDGLGMLLHQAVPGFEAWFGVTPKVTEQLRAKVLKTLEG
jgi:shikimate dehydrogenase